MYICIYIISYFEMVLQGRWLVHNVNGISRLLRTFLICFQNICHCVLFYLSCNWEEPNVRTNTVCCQWLQEMFTQINKKKNVFVIKLWLTKGDVRILAEQSEYENQSYLRSLVFHMYLNGTIPTLWLNSTHPVKHTGPSLHSDALEDSQHGK